ncbi:MAG: autotransporter-associated beta strand repeat-containing protein [Opitutaceae bacterium]|nr:autotransporter-associated beta strand repeat-containing protein [Opitutaceae bacterium]
MKNGAGTLTLSGANTFTGTTAVNAGTLAISHASALGTAAGGTIVSTGAILSLSGGITVAGEALTLAGTLRGASGSNTYGGAITLSGGGVFESAVAGQTLTLSGGVNLSTHQATFAGAGDISVSGVVSNSAGSVVKNGTGTLTFAAANTYVGSTTINAGTLVISHGTALGTTAAGTTVASGATLAFTGSIAVGAEALTVSGAGAGGTGALRNLAEANAFAGDVTFAGDTTLTSAAGGLSLTGALAAGGHTLTVNGAGNLTFASTVADAVDLVKTGAGALTFAADQTFSGEVTLGGGTLALSNADVSIATLRITAGSILDFGGTSVLTVGELILDLADGQFLSITSWQDYTDFFCATEFAGAEFDLRGVAPMNRILFADFGDGDTRWQSGNNEITPVPEPAAYGLLSLGALLAAPWLRRRRRAAVPAVVAVAGRDGNGCQRPRDSA